MDGETASIASDQATIVNQRGLHARAAARLAALAEGFDAKIEITGNGLSVSALSIMDLLLLAAAPGTLLEVSATGKNAKAAVTAVVKLIEAGFGED
jgi:phosphocarrier protein